MRVHENAAPVPANAVVLAESPGPLQDHAVFPPEIHAYGEESVLISQENADFFPENDASGPEVGVCGPENAVFWTENADFSDVSAEIQSKEHFP